MKLTYIETENLKRLKGRQKMPVLEKVICIVGQNSAGKSTFLDALGQCLNGPAFEEHDGTREGLAYLPPSMKLFFRLEDSDRNALDDIFGAEKLRGAWVSADTGGFRQVVAHPDIPRDVSLRAPAVKAIEKAEGAIQPLFEEINTDGTQTDLRTQTDELLPIVRDSLTSSDLYLDHNEIEAVNRLASHFSQIASTYRSWVAENDPDRDDKDRKQLLAGDLKAAEDALDRVATKESEDAPADLAASILNERIPYALWFSSEDRSLEASYPIVEDRPDDHAAIHNILKLAETSWEQVVEIAQKDVSFHAQFVEETRKALKCNFSEKLSSHSIPGVALWLSDGLLHVQTELDQHMRVPIDFQSEGTRQMVALLAFIANRSSNTNPIILIDEAEQHLHYDAQADLVKVFEHQPEASKVVYTTHSAGCLPSDIAIGVRGILSENTYSVIEDNIWKKESGYSPLMIAMGASAFGFGTARSTVFTEGLTDAQLLPRLIREAVEEDVLRYQMVPHFASANVKALKELELEAPRIAFIADHDEGGDSHYQRILTAGYKEDQIVDLGEGATGKLYLEDLVRPKILEQALDALTTTEGNFPATEIPKSGRWDYIDKILGGLDEGVVRFDKKKLASHILDIDDKTRFTKPTEGGDHDQGLLDRRHKDSLVKADTALKEILEREKPGRTEELEAGTSQKEPIPSSR